MMHNWFECKICYEKVMEDGKNKKVTEPYLVDALSFTEAEARIIEEMKPFITGEFTVAEIKRANYSEIFYASDASKIDAAETNKLLKGVKDGKEAAEKVYNIPIDWNADNIDTIWFKVKLNFITFDEKSGKEKLSPCLILVEAVDINNAKENADNGMKGTMADYKIESISQTKIVNIYPFKTKVDEGKN